MRLGLIGLGRIGAFHAETLIGLPGVESLVVIDPLPAAVDRVTAMFDVDTAGTADELLRAGVDGVVIASATNAHPQLILAAVEAAVPVFCEKPVARDAQEAVAVLRRVEAAGVPVQIGYNRRFDPGFVAARRAVIWRAGSPPHRAIHHDGPGAPARGIYRGIRRHLPRLQRP